MTPEGMKDFFVAGAGVAASLLSLLRLHELTRKNAREALFLIGGIRRELAKLVRDDEATESQKTA